MKPKLRRNAFILDNSILEEKEITDVESVAAVTIKANTNNNGGLSQDIVNGKYQLSIVERNFILPISPYTVFFDQWLNSRKVVQSGPMGPSKKAGAVILREL